MEKDKELKEKKPTNTRVKLTVGILFLVVLSVVELYLMINFSDSYLFLGLVGLAILCFVYWTMDLSFKIHREQEGVLDKDFESLYKAQKVSYITVKQGFTKLEELLDELGEELSFPLEEVLSAQKAVGRVTIQKNKENFDVVVASNEKLIEHLESFEQKFAEIGSQIEALNAAAAAAPAALAGGQSENRQDEILDALARMEDMLKTGMANTGVPDRQQEILDSLGQIGEAMEREFGREPAADRQQEILDYLARIEASVKDEISELEVHMESKIDEIPSAVQEEQKMSAEELDLLLGEAGALMESVNLDLPDEKTAADASDVSGQPEAGTEPNLADIPGAFEMPGEGILSDVRQDAEESYEIPEHLLMAEEAGTEMPPESAMSDEAAAEEPFEIPEGMDLFGAVSAPEEAAESFEIPEGMDLFGTVSAPEAAAESFEIPEGMDLPGAEESYEIPEHLLMPEPDGEPDAKTVSEEPAAAEAAPEKESDELQESMGLPDAAKLPEAGMNDAQSTSEPVVIPEIPPERIGSEKVMTPEEIAALLGEPGEPEEAASAAEETQPMPDLSDPGHVMTPEEIAALLANM